MPSLNFGQVTDRQTDDGQKVMHNSPPCISTGLLKNRKGQETEENSEYQIADKKK